MGWLRACHTASSGDVPNLLLPPTTADVGCVAWPALPIGQVKSCLGAVLNCVCRLLNEAERLRSPKRCRLTRSGCASLGGSPSAPLLGAPGAFRRAPACAAPGAPRVSPAGTDAAELERLGAPEVHSQCGQRAGFGLETETGWRPGRRAQGRTQEGTDAHSPNEALLFLMWINTNR